MSPVLQKHEHNLELAGCAIEMPIAGSVAPLVCSGWNKVIDTISVKASRNALLPYRLLPISVPASGKCGLPWEKGKFEEVPSIRTLLGKTVGLPEPPSEDD